MYKNSFCKFYINVIIPKDYTNFINYKNVKIPKMIKEFEDFMKFDNESAVISYYKNKNIEYKVIWPYSTYLSLINYYIYEFIKIHNEYKDNISIYNEIYSIFNGDFEDFKHPKEYNFYIPYLNTEFNKLGLLKCFKPLTNNNYEDFIIKLKKHDNIENYYKMEKWRCLNEKQIYKINDIFEQNINKFILTEKNETNDYNNIEYKDIDEIEDENIIEDLYDKIKEINNKPKLIIDKDDEELDEDDKDDVEELDDDD